MLGSLYKIYANCVIFFSQNILVYYMVSKLIDINKQPCNSNFDFMRSLRYLPDVCMQIGRLLGKVYMRINSRMGIVSLEVSYNDLR